MKILLANNHLQKTGGTENYIYALAVELKRQGHIVEYFTFRKGPVSELLEREKIFYSAFFFSPTSDSPVQILQELEQLLDGTKKEMTEIDLGVLQDEKDQLDQNLIEIVAQLDDIKQKMQELISRTTGVNKK